MNRFIYFIALAATAVSISACSSDEPSIPPSSRASTEYTMDENVYLRVNGRVSSGGNATVGAYIESKTRLSLYNCVISIHNSANRIIAQKNIGTISLDINGTWSNTYTFYSSEMMGTPSSVSFSADNGKYSSHGMLITPIPGDHEIVLP